MILAYLIIHYTVGIVIEAAKILGVKTFTSPKDLCSGNPRLAMGFAAQLFNARHGLPSLSPAGAEQCQQLVLIIIRYTYRESSDLHCFHVRCIIASIDIQHCPALIALVKNGESLEGYLVSMVYFHLCSLISCETLSVQTSFLSPPTKL